MSLSTPDTIVSNTTSQPANRRSKQPAGLRIEGLPPHTDFEEISVNEEYIEFCAPRAADSDSLQTPQAQKSGSESMQSIVKDGS